MTTFQQLKAFRGHVAIWNYQQTGLEKTGAKTPMTLLNVIGKESMTILSI